MAFNTDQSRRIARATRTVEDRRWDQYRDRQILPDAYDDSIAFKPNATIPAYGVMIVDTATAADTSTGLVVVATKQADQAAGFGKTILINGGSEVASGDTGASHDGFRPIQVLYDTADGTPAVGEFWGVGKDSYKLRKYLPGFQILQAGDSSTQTVCAIRKQVTRIFGKNDAAVAYSDTTGRTVSVWKHDWSADLTGQDLTLVLPPPTMTTGTILITSFVGVWVRNDGRYVMDLAPC
jgi:hypothetical protein